LRIADLAPSTGSLLSKSGYSSSSMLEDMYCLGPISRSQDSIAESEKRCNNQAVSSPGNFIPLPAQWMAQARYVGRYDSTDVFYFDFCSLALSKISRGNDRDLYECNSLHPPGELVYVYRAQ